MRKIIAFVTLAVLINALAVAQMMPDRTMSGGMMGSGMIGGDKSKSSEERESHCAQMMKQMSEMMKQMSEMKSHMSQMMEGGMMGGMIEPK